MAPLKIRLLSNKVGAVLLILGTTCFLLSLAMTGLGGAQEAETQGSVSPNGEITIPETTTSTTTPTTVQQTTTSTTTSTTVPQTTTSTSTTVPQGTTTSTTTTTTNPTTTTTTLGPQVQDPQVGGDVMAATGFGAVRTGLMLIGLSMAFAGFLLTFGEREAAKVQIPFGPSED